MTKNASEIPSVMAMSDANVFGKKDLRDVIVNRISALYVALKGLGNDPIISGGEDPDLTGRIQHVDLAKYYAQVGEATDHLCKAYDILATMHNDQTAHGEFIGIVMNAPNGGGGDR